MGKGDDGRPDFAARKACNYLQDSVEVGDGNSKLEIIASSFRSQWSWQSELHKYKDMK